MSRIGLTERLLCLLFPQHCLLCDKIISAGGSVCPACEKILPDRPLVRRFNVCGRELTVLSAMEYRDGFRHTLHRYKFKSEFGLSRQIGRLMADVFSDKPDCDAVTWVPMSKAKKRLRGYDQSELLAKAVAKQLGVPCVCLLEKTRETDTQHELGRADRAENIKNAYRASSTAGGRDIILIDDIVTTGATLCECAAELYAAGAKSVLGLCAADTPDKKEEEL